MALADAEQWLGLGVVVVWLAFTAYRVVAARRLPDRRPPSWPVLAATGAAALLFAAQATVVDAVADPSGIAAADAPTLQWMVAHRDAGATGVFDTASNLGGTAGMTVLAAIAAVVLWVRRRRAEALVVVVATAGAGLLVELLKRLYARQRPPVATQLMLETGNSLPSGHTVGSTVVLGILAAVAVRILRGAAARTAAVALAVVLVATIGASRLYLGVHWFTDVLDGWLLGGAWLALCIALLTVVARRSRGSGLQATVRIPAGPARTATPDVEDPTVPLAETARLDEGRFPIRPASPPHLRPASPWGEFRAAPRRNPDGNG